MPCIPTPAIPELAEPLPITWKPPVPQIPGADLNLCCTFPIRPPQIPIPPIVIPSSIALRAIVAGFNAGRKALLAAIRSLEPECPRN